MHIKKIWDEIYKESGTLSSIDKNMPKIVKVLKERNAKKVLDLGYGSGRHTVYLAKQGFEVSGIDISEEGLKIATYWLKEKSLFANLVLGSIYEPLPYKDSSFDAVICIRTLNHARIKTIRKTIKEIKRVLKPKGLIFITTRKKVPKKQRLPFKEIDSHTYIPLEGKEKGIVHYLFTRETLRKEFKCFKVNIWVDSRNGYYCLLGELKSSEKGNFNPE